MNIREDGQLLSSAAETRLNSVLHSELRRIVRSVLAHDRPNRVLETAAVLTEAFLRIASSRRGVLASPEDWQARARFMMAAAPQLRDAIRSFVHRGGLPRQAVGMGFGSSPLGERERIYDFCSVDQLLTRLAASETNLASTLELVCFGGMTDREIAFVLDIPLSKATRDRECAWNWLLKRMPGETEQKASKHQTSS